MMSSFLWLGLSWSAVLVLFDWVVQLAQCRCRQLRYGDGRAAGRTMQVAGQVLGQLEGVGADTVDEARLAAPRVNGSPSTYMPDRSITPPSCRIAPLWSSNSGSSHG